MKSVGLENEMAGTMKITVLGASVNLRQATKFLQGMYVQMGQSARPEMIYTKFGILRFFFSEIRRDGSKFD